LTPSVAKEDHQSSSEEYYQLDDTYQKVVQVGIGVRCPASIENKNWIAYGLTDAQRNMRFYVYNQGRADSEGFIIVERHDNLGDSREEKQGWDIPLKVLCTKRPKKPKKPKNDGSSLDKNGNKYKRQTLDESNEGLAERLWSTDTNAERIAVTLPSAVMNFGPASLLRQVPNVAYNGEGHAHTPWDGLQDTQFSRNFISVWSGMIRIPQKGNWKFSLETIGGANAGRLFVSGDRIPLSSLDDDPWAASNTGESPVFQEDGIADRNYKATKHVRGVTRALEDIDTESELLIKKQQFNTDLASNRKTISGDKTLGSGIHAIEVLLVSRGMHNRAILYWEGPGMAKSVVPPSAFFVTPGQMVATSNWEDDKNTAGGEGVKANDGNLDIYLNDVKLTTGSHGNPGPVPSFHYMSHTEWSYSLRPWQIAHLSDGVNTVRVERAAGTVNDKNKRTMVLSSSMIEARVGITNEFFQGDGATTAMIVPYNTNVYNGMRDEFTMMAWVKLEGDDTEDEDVVAARHEHFVLHATGGSWKEGEKGSKKVPTGGLQVFWTDGTNDAVVGYETPKARWFHYSATYDGTGLIVFINGKQVGYTEVGQKIMGPATPGGNTYLAKAKKDKMESDVAFLTPLDTDDKAGKDVVTIGAALEKREYVPHLLVEYWQTSSLRRLSSKFGGKGENGQWDDLSTAMGESRARNIGDMGSSMGSELDQAQRRALGAGYAVRWSGYISLDRDTPANQLLAASWLDGGAQVSIVTSTTTLVGKIGLAKKVDVPSYRLVDGDNAYMGRLETWNNGAWQTVCDEEVSNEDVTRELNRAFGEDKFVGCKIVPYENRATYMGDESTKISLVADVGKKSGKKWTFVKNLNCDHTEDLIVDCKPAKGRWGNKLALGLGATMLKAGVKYKITASAFATVAPVFDKQNKKLLEITSSNKATVSFWSKGGEFAYRMDGGVDDVKMFREGMTAQQVLLEMFSLKSDAELEAEKTDGERKSAELEAKKKIKEITDKDDTETNKVEDEEIVAASTLMMAYSFEGAGTGGVEDDSEHDLLAKTKGALPLRRVVHPMSSHIWKNCPGVSSDPTTINICGGYDDEHKRTRGYCDLSENPPKCHCSKHYRGPGCELICPTDKKMGVCSNRGDCHWAQEVDQKKGAEAVAGVEPKPGQASWCACNKASEDKLGFETRYLGSMCEKECPASKKRTCSGHGTCMLTSEGIGIMKASCSCKDGWYGAGCEKTCAGSLDDKDELSDKSLAASFPLKGTCSGHGKCTFTDQTHHLKCGNNPHRCGSEMGKQCACDHHGGWNPYPFAGGTCLESCPGADGEAGSFLNEDIIFPKSKHPAHGGICNAAGISWNEETPALFDATSGRKHRGCLLKHMSHPVLDKLEEHCVKKTGQHCNKMSMKWDGKTMDFGTLIKEDKAGDELRKHMKNKHSDPGFRKSGGWGGQCRECDEMRIPSGSWEDSCASQDLPSTFFPFNKMCDGSTSSNTLDGNIHTRRCGNRFSHASQCKCPVGNLFEQNAIKLSGMNLAWNWRGVKHHNFNQCVIGDNNPSSSSSGDAGYTDKYRGFYDVQGSGKCKEYCRWVGDSGSGGDPKRKVVHEESFWSCRTHNQEYTHFEIARGPTTKKYPYYGKKWNPSLVKCDIGSGTEAIDLQMRKNIGSGTGMWDAIAFQKEMKPGWPLTDTHTLSTYPGLKGCGEIHHSGYHKTRSRKGPGC